MLDGLGSGRMDGMSLECSVLYCRDAPKVMGLFVSDGHCDTSFFVGQASHADRPEQWGGDTRRTLPVEHAATDRDKKWLLEENARKAAPTA
jgi:hypothetical protein